MNCPKEIVMLFKEDLWKDQRQLQMVKRGGREYIIKFYDDKLEFDTETKVIKYLIDDGIDFVPKIEVYNDHQTIMPYYNGIRLFNLFVDLDAIRQADNEVSDQVFRVKQFLLERAEKQQKTIQDSLIRWRSTNTIREPYPHAKLKSIVRILSSCLGIVIEEDCIFSEISEIDEYWKTVVNVPFRDATTKNMILMSPQLYGGNFYSDKERRELIYKDLRNCELPNWVSDPIIDYDFSSCIHDTTYEDDVISLKHHERTWIGKVPDESQLLWNGTPDGKRAAITFLIRYFRFGGRKAAYRLIHPTGHRIRFKYDDDIFYFSRLPEIMYSLWPETYDRYPNLIEFINYVSKYLVTSGNSIDYFLQDKNKISVYYTDVFPQ